MTETDENNARPMVDEVGKAAVLDYAPALKFFCANGTSYEDAATLFGAIGGKGNQTGGWTIGPSKDEQNANSIPFEGWQPNGYSLFLDFTTDGQTPAGDQVLWQSGTVSQKDSVCVVRGSDKNLKVIVTSNSIQQAHLEMGPVENSARARLAITLGTSYYVGGLTKAQMHFTACLNGGPLINSAPGKQTFPEPAQIWLACAPEQGKEFRGRMHRVTVLAGQLRQQYIQYLSSVDQTNQILLAGDSYAGGARGVVLGNMLAEFTTRTVINAGVGGSTMTQIRDIIKTLPWAYKLTWVIWDGSANQYKSVRDYYGLIDEIYGMIGQDRIVFLPPVAVGPSKDGSVIAYTRDMIAIYNRLVADGRITFNPQTVLAEATPAKSRQDELDDLAKVIRQSYLLDGVHLASEPMSHIASQIKSVLENRDI